jgi:uncharacterized phage protein (TIGR02218 family)
MRVLPAGLQARLDAGVTTLCRCFILTRRDGVVQGFTDHDRDIVLNGVVCRADTGLAASEATARLGLAVEGAEIAGALSDDSLTEADLAAGRFDAARIETYLVDWSDPALHLLLTTSKLGEVRREGGAFSAEMRGIADALAQETGRSFTASCTADLGDARCGVDLANAACRGMGSVTVLRGTSSFAADGLAAFAENWFDAGRLTFTGGANEGLAVEVKRHRLDGGQIVLELWQAMPQAIAIDDPFIVTAGCDKRFATCRERFGNAVNFRGFPHIPGNDFVVRYAVAGEPGHDGTALRTSS